MNIGENIRKIRKSKKMSGEALGISVGVSPQAILQYERGVREPKKEMLEKIAATLECTVADLYGWDEKYNSKQLSNDVKQLEKINELKKLLHKLYPNDYNFLIDLFNRLGLMDTDEN